MIILLAVAVAAMGIWCKKAKKGSVERRVSGFLVIVLLGTAAMLFVPEGKHRAPAAVSLQQQREAQATLERMRAAKSLIVTLEFETHLRVAPLADPYSGVQFTRSTLEQGLVNVLFVGYEGAPTKLSFWQDDTKAWRIGCVYGGIRHDLQAPEEGKLRDLTEARGHCPSLYPNSVKVKENGAAG